MWPRHTGDFGYLRAYVSKDGKSAAFSNDNVPYQPKPVLKVNPHGVEAGDYVMVVGYPGRTHRYRLADGVQISLACPYPTKIKVRSYERRVGKACIHTCRFGWWT